MVGCMGNEPNWGFIELKSLKLFSLNANKLHEKLAFIITLLLLFGCTNRVEPNRPNFMLWVLGWCMHGMNMLPIL
jgi:hypothetical protein